MHLILPKIKSVRLEGYYPLFDQPVEFDIEKDLYILLGGNGLGKTTILQSIIYGVAGPADANIEPTREDKFKRWGRDYFADRLSNHSKAYIDVKLEFGDNSIEIRRGFASNNILSFTRNGEFLSDKKSETEDLFEQFLVEEVGYSGLNEFYYIFHKLCYLSENRENLVWNVNAQTRILMQLFSDTTTEYQFRKRREELKNLDTKIRHKNVAVNKQQKVVDQLKLDLSTEKKAHKNESEDEMIAMTDNTAKESEFKDSQKELVQVGEKIRITQKQLKERKITVAHKASEIEELRQQINKYEEDFLMEQISQIENTETSHAIYKLIHHKLCPSCGNQNDELHQKAVEYIKNKQCPLCGIESSLDEPTIKPGWEASMSELLKDKIDIEQEILQLEPQLEELMDRSIILNNEINKFLVNRPQKVVYIHEDAPPSENKLAENESALSLLQKEKRDYQIQFDSLQKELDDTYKNFAQINNSRVERLGEIYSDFASDFLGVKCELEPVVDNSDFFDLNLFVPTFLGKVRARPTSCSEAQRFFLDIAFRMSVIELSNEMSSHKGTFICETPENALDISYINNVTEMFFTFSKENNNTLIVSSNIQPAGIAETILTRLRKDERQLHFLNMIEIGKLSDVQANGYGAEAIEEILDRILNEPRFS
ncbi:AAA domain-containing protein [Marivirga sericea]|uniref:AAA domain-containing protein n=1 Tax=Marivirga sericea TaxID=1028 RepID=A0A1X7IHH0_9BACT|nr:AAA family ATPase [Marivirga sericea]SMG14192.1 AAA domain-containing protein [Marivirga sericea]